MNRRQFLISSSTFAVLTGCQETSVSTDFMPSKSSFTDTVNSEITPYRIVSNSPSYLNSRRNMGGFNFQSDSNNSGGYPPSRPNGKLFVTDPQPYHYQVITDPFGNAPSNLVERFEWRNGDCLGVFDCNTYRARVEILGDGGQDGEESWYRWSIYIPENFQADGLGEIYGQFKAGPDDMLFIEILGGRQSVKRLRASVRLNDWKHFNLAQYTDLIGKWTEITIHTKWGQEGFHHFYINRKLINTYVGATCRSGDKLTFKYGIYGSQSPELFSDFMSYPENRSKYPMLISKGEFPDRVIFYSNVHKASRQELLRS